MRLSTAWHTEQPFTFVIGYDDTQDSSQNFRIDEEIPSREVEILRTSFHPEEYMEHWGLNE